jgi:hypothetical protein
MVWQTATHGALVHGAVSGLYRNRYRDGGYLMLTLLGSVLGFATSFAPRIFEHFQDKADRAHELAMVDRQMEQMRLGSELKLQEINVQADIAETRAIYRHDATMKNDGWVGGLRASVRPVVTYLLLGLLIAIKSVGLYALVVLEGMMVSEALPQIWDDQTGAVWAAVVSFWFGARSMTRSK